MNKNLLDLMPQYDGYIFDIWGVVYDGSDPFPGAIEDINHLIDAGKKIYFISNTPRPALLTANRLINWGVKIKAEQLMSSGELVRKQLTNPTDEVFTSLGKIFYHLGEERNQDILAGIEVQTTDDLNQADFILSSLYLTEEEDLSQYDNFLKQAVYLNKIMICANPDKIALRDKFKIYCAGTFAAYYENLGGKVYYYGKPHRQLFDQAMNYMAMQGIAKDRIIMIGDTIDTDIKGARAIGIDSAVVRSGNFYNDYLNTEKSLEQIIENLEFQPDIVIAKLGDICL